MGPNGTGKSTLASVIAGKDGYNIESGQIFFNGKDLMELEVDERAREGLFLGFQYPVEVPGVSMINFMRTALNQMRKHRGQDELSGAAFMKLMNEKKELVNIDSDMTHRSVNTGFSGGEKKRNEIFQMAILDPKLSILDETDSGLDIDALKVVANGVNKLHRDYNATILITHYQRLLDYIIPDYVHVMYGGRIVKSGDKSLALELEEKGYEWLRDHAIV
jgi:Fe-S cluster assembly ATP-binding protein